MTRELDVRDFTDSRVSADRVATLERAASEVSDRLPADHRVRIVGFDATTGNPAVVRSDATASDGADVVRRAIEHVTAIGPALGLSATQAPEFVADPVVQETTSGARTVHLQQRYKGIPIFQAAEAVRFAPDGALADAVGNIITVEGDLPVSAALSAPAAARVAAEYVAEPDADERAGTDVFGEPYEPSRVDLGGYQPVVRAAVPGSPERASVLSGGPFGADIPVSLVWFPLRQGPVLSWLATLTMPGRAEQYRTIVDANSGKVLYCCQTVHTVAARGNVYRKYGTERTMTDFPLPVTAYPLDVAAPTGFPPDWLPQQESSGNSVFAHLGDHGDPMGGTVHNGVVTFDPQDPTGDDQKVLNIFYLNCYMHDYFYLLGFRESDGNFQLDNQGHGGLSGDPVDARAHSGAVQGTANMGTPVDGLSPEMNMGLVTRTGRHTAFDSDVVFHEFMHGVTNRLVGGAMNVDALDSPQSGGMGEGWGDYVACTVNDVTVVGSWVTSLPGGIRGFPYDSAFPDDFGELGQGRYTEVHNIGEIWCATLLEVNRNIGARLAMQLVVDALKLSPPNPSFLNMRDAILRAMDDARTAGRLSDNEHATAFEGLWAAFAKFGMGVNAQSNGAQLRGILADRTVPARP